MSLFHGIFRSTWVIGLPMLLAAGCASTEQAPPPAVESISEKSDWDRSVETALFEPWTTERESEFEFDTVSHEAAVAVSEPFGTSPPRFMLPGPETAGGPLGWLSPPLPAIAVEIRDAVPLQPDTSLASVWPVTPIAPVARILPVSPVSSVSSVSSVSLATPNTPVVAIEAVATPNPPTTGPFAMAEEERAASDEAPELVAPEGKQTPEPPRELPRAANGGDTQGPQRPLLHVELPDLPGWAILGGHPSDSPGGEGRVDPKRLHSLVTAAVCELEGNRPEAAVAMLEPSLAEFGDSAAIFRVLGTAHYRLGDYHASQVALQQALLLNDTSALSHFLMGCTLSKLGQPLGAEPHFERAAQLAPEYVGRLESGGTPSQVGSG